MRHTEKEVVIVGDNNTAYIMNLEEKTRRTAPIWTKEQWREYTHSGIESKYGAEVANWFRQFDEK